MLRSSAEMFATFLNISFISYDCQNMLVAKTKMGRLLVFTLNPLHVDRL